VTSQGNPRVTVEKIAHCVPSMYLFAVCKPWKFIREEEEDESSGEKSGEDKQSVGGFADKLSPLFRAAR